MNLKEPSAELDLAVAKAAGIEVTLSNWLDDPPVSWVLEHDPEWGRLETMGCVLVVVATGKRWNPSRDMNHAMEAAAKVGLFDYPSNLGKHPMGIEADAWCFEINYRCGDLKKFIYAPTAPLAISAAILETQKGKSDAPEDD